MCKTYLCCICSDESDDESVFQTDGDMEVDPEDMFCENCYSDIDDGIK